MLELAPKSSWDRKETSQFLSKGAKFKKSKTAGTDPLCFADLSRRPPPESSSLWSLSGPYHRLMKEE